MVTETTETIEQPKMPSVEDQAKAAEDLFSKYSLAEKQSAVFLHKAILRRQELLYKASSAVLRRVAVALDKAPFEDGFKPTMGDENELYQLGLQIVNAKNFLLLSSEERKKIEEKVTTQTIEVKETANGKLD